MQIVSRAEARVARLPRYFTGTPCVHGHVTERRTSNATCSECLRIAALASYYQNRDAVSSGRRVYYAAHKQKYAERAHRYYLAHKDVLLAYQIAHRKRWPEKRRALHQRRRAGLRGAVGSYSAIDVARIYALQRGKCAYCRTGLGRNFHRDHIIPLARGGSNWPRNIQLLCEQCNLRKTDDDPLDWARKTGRLL